MLPGGKKTQKNELNILEKRLGLNQVRSVLLQFASAFSASKKIFALPFKGLRSEDFC